MTQYSIYSQRIIYVVIGRIETVNMHKICCNTTQNTEISGFQS